MYVLSQDSTFINVLVLFFYFLNYFLTHFKYIFKGSYIWIIFHFWIRIFLQVYYYKVKHCITQIHIHVLFGLVCCFILMFALAEAAADLCVSVLSLGCVKSSRTVRAMERDPQTNKQTRISYFDHSLWKFSLSSLNFTFTYSENILLDTRPF